YKINYENSVEEENFNVEEEKEFNLIPNTYEAGVRLNVEVRVAGGLIWDSIERLSKISSFPKHLEERAEPNNTEDCYMCIYNASQGIERLQKSLIELILCKDNCKVEDEERTYNLLMSHNHKLLHEYIKKKYNIENKKFGKLIEDLSLFYNKIRYNNYDDESEYNRTYFYDILCSYADKPKIIDSISVVELESFKMKFASALGDYARSLYKTINDISSELNIFTYELDSTQKSALVYFGDDNINLYKKYLRFKMSKKEVLYFLALNGKSIFKDYLEIEPLNFDEALISNYCKSIIENNDTDYFDCFDELYSELCEKNKGDFKKREAFINFIFSDDFDLAQIYDEGDK
ncbi:MAG: hypothetical protein HUJ61_04750, partial [Bacilli bacterium]|nr:hypothetical protein [Bacilli bacterium]